MLETDYLIVGAGAAGMAFVDTLIAHSDADVVMVDRRHRPGGHWIDAYPFVRLHQPSATYGVNSRALGTETIDTAGSNAGFYERATCTEICDYFDKVLDEQLLPSNKVRFFGGCDYVGDWSTDNAMRSRLTGTTTEVRVRRKVVDTTYLHVTVPATHAPAFEIDEGVRFIPVGYLADLSETPSGYTILGAGKTAMDACNWLLDNGVDPVKIRWVKPRESWVFDRASFQPLDLVVEAMEELSLSIEALALAESVDDLFPRLEAFGGLCRIDTTVEPTMFRGAILSKLELESLRRIENVVRLGRVSRLSTNRIVLEDGEISTSPSEVHVDCTASGFRTAPAVPIFEPGRITLQSLMGGFTTFNAALIAFVEATRDADEEKNRLCPPTPQPTRPIDWIPSYANSLKNFAMHSAEPDLSAWLQSSRLNTTRGLSDHMDDPLMQDALTRWGSNIDQALQNADRFLSDSSLEVSSV